MGKIIVIVFGGIVFIVAFAALSIVGAIPTYFLWNWLMPELFAIKSITFWQAWGINFLTAILFNGTSSTTSKS